SLDRRVRSVTVNATESPLGWLHSRGLVTQRQYDAGERLRSDWERAQLAPRMTMAWNAAPVARGRGGAGDKPDLTGAQIDPRSRTVGSCRLSRDSSLPLLLRMNSSPNISTRQRASAAYSPPSARAREGARR